MYCILSRDFVDGVHSVEVAEQWAPSILVVNGPSHQARNFKGRPRPDLDVNFLSTQMTCITALMIGVVPTAKTSAVSLVVRLNS